jgi:hypothetical protein
MGLAQDSPAAFLLVQVWSEAQYASLEHSLPAGQATPIAAFATQTDVLRLQCAPVTQNAPLVHAVPKSNVGLHVWSLAQ